MSTIESITAWATSPKTTASVAAATTTSGLSEMFGWIPSDIGRLAALAGFILTCVLIYINLISNHRKEKIEDLAAKKLQLEIDEIKRRQRTEEKS